MVLARRPEVVHRSECLILAAGVDNPTLLLIVLGEAFGFVSFTAAIAAAIWGPRGIPRWASACVSETAASPFAIASRLDDRVPRRGGTRDRRRCLRSH